jgi:hypothetical protein
MTKLVLKTPAQITKMIASVKARGGTLQQGAHDTAVQAMMHFEATGDTVFMTRLYHALPVSMRKAALAAWFEGFSPVKLRTVKLQDGSKVKLFKKFKGTEAPAMDVTGGIASPFYSYTKEAKPIKAISTIEIRKALEKLAKKADKELQKGNVEGDASEVEAFINSVLGLAA